MREVKYLLIGGGVAAYNAAKQIRRTDAEGSVLLASEDALPPYDVPPLSKEYLRGEKTDADIIFEPAEALAAEKIEVVLGTRVESLDAASKAATLADGETVRFEKALIATGARPIRLPIPGADLAGVHYLRTAADSRGIAADAAPGKRAVIIGGGFIGLEIAASLTQMGVGVTVVEALPRIWMRFADERLASFVQEYCAARDVAFRTNEKVSEIRGEGRASGVVTGSGVLDCDFVCIGVGIVPNVELARDAGLQVDNGVRVDEYMRTSSADIYAAGDVINFPDPIFQKHHRVEHWGNAEYTGQIAGRNMAGAEMPYDLLSYVWSDIFDLHLEAAGDESERDEVVVRGEPGQGPFSVLYVKDARLTAYFSVNVSPAEFSVFRRLIRMKTDVGGRLAELTDPAFNVRGLL